MSKEAMKLALEALERHAEMGLLAGATITALREALAEQPAPLTADIVKMVLRGIDQTEIESSEGWWETSTGAEFGAKKLQQVIDLLTQPAPPPECQTEAEKTAFAFGWWKALESVRQQPAQQEPVAWKLVPREPTHEMLKAMDECSTEGYDERLYAGHASSVYMAAVDAAPTPPAQRKPLTDEEIILIVAECAASHQHTDIHFARAIERAHGIKELV